MNHHCALFRTNNIKGHELTIIKDLVVVASNKNTFDIF